MASPDAHPFMTIARGTMHAAALPRLRARAANGPLGAPFVPHVRMTLADRAAAYRRLHADPGVHPVGRDTFALAGYADVRTAARAHDVLVSGKGVTQLRTALPMMLMADRPRHDDLRRLVAPLFTPARSAQMEAGMRALVVHSLEHMLATPGADAVQQLAVPLPMTVIAWMLGVPEEDIGRLHRWSDRLIESLNVSLSLRSVPTVRRIRGALLDMHRYMLGVFARLRLAPGDDVISALLASNEVGALGDDELFWFGLMLVLAGNETTTNLIGALLLALAQDPEAYERLRAEPALVPSAVEEGLRWGSPIQGLYRTAASDYGVGATTIPAGARVLLLFGAANRDPGKFPEPDRFVIDRDPDHLAFGTGIHFCLGAHLARIEARVVLEELITRVAEVELAGPVCVTRNPDRARPDPSPTTAGAHLMTRLDLDGKTVLITGGARVVPELVAQGPAPGTRGLRTHRRASRRRLCRLVLGEHHRYSPDAVSFTTA